MQEKLKNQIPKDRINDIDSFKRKQRKRYMDLPKEWEWKTLNDQYFTPQDAVRVYKNMLNANLIPPLTEDYTFFSAASYIPTQEMAIAQADQEERKGKSDFIVGDWVASKLCRENAGSFRERMKEIPSFKYIEWDAEHLPLRNDSVNTIWDIKGWLWHLAELKNRERFFATIDQYYGILKENGCIVIDNIDMDKNLEGYTPSTVEKIDEMIGSNPGNENTWEKLKERFDILDIGEGKTRVRILKKRP